MTYTAVFHSQREIVTQRDFTAPRERVFRAWAEPERLAAWWGPGGTVPTLEEFDRTPGGHWRFSLRGLDGRDQPNDIVFVTLESARPLVFDQVSQPKHRLEATLLETETGTQVTCVMRFETVAECEAVRAETIRENEAFLDRLGVELAAMA